MLSKRKTIALVTFVVVACGVLFFTFSKKTKDEPAATPGLYLHTTSSGKKISIKDSHPTSDALSTVNITTEGFQTNNPITLEKNKLTNVYFVDLNSDDHDEVVIVFTSQTAPHYGEAVVYTTFNDSELAAIEMPGITEDDTATGGLFEGYLGGDIFVAEKNKLLRTFFVEDTESEDTSNESSPPESANQGEEIVDDAVTVTEKESDQLLEIQEESPATSTQILEVPMDSFATSTETVEGEVKKQKQKTVAYSLLYEDGFFSLEPGSVETVKQLTASSTAALPATTWKWLSLNHKGNLVVPNVNDPLMIRFMEDGTFYASSTCGSFASGYASTGNILRIGSLVALSSSGDTVCSSQLSTLKSHLPNVESFVIRDNQLMITLDQNDGVILFIRQ